MSLPIGIDLGTTNSVISVYRRGKAETLRVDGALTVPSAVCFRDAGNTLVGTKALGMAMIRPESTILNVKRKMGLRDAKQTIHGKDYSPVDVSAMILKKLCEGHEDELGGPARDAVITVPAYFTDEQRKDTKLAGEKAGLNVLRLLPEPTAAAIAIGLDKGRDQTILVYDLGGGTFDVSILKVENNDFTVLAVNGDHDLGGNDFDAALREYALDAFQKQSGVNLQQKKGFLDFFKKKQEEFKDPDLRQAVQALTTACERVKMELSEAEEAYLDLPNFYQGHHLETSIDRRTFEGLIKDKVYHTKNLVLKTIAEANLDVDDIDRLVLVGGSTKIPLVSRVLTDTVKEPFVAENVDLVVSEGAAIMAANLHAVQEGGQAGVDYAPIEVTDVVAHPISLEFGYLGVRAQPASGERTYCQVIIAKNSPLPSSGWALATPVDASRGTVSAKVYRGSAQSPRKNEFLGTLVSTFPPSTAHGEVWFLDELTLNESGVLVFECSLVDARKTNLKHLLSQGRNPKERYDELEPKEKLKVINKVSTTIKLPAG